MADTIVASTAHVNMVDLPFAMQAAGGDTPLQYTARDFRGLLDGMFASEGVLGTPDFKVVQRGAGANFSVDVQAGYAAVNGDAVSEQGKYLVRSVGVVNLVTPGAPASGTRQHHVILRIRDKKEDAGATQYDWSLELLEDTGSGSPVLPGSALSLGKVTISAGQSNVTSANIGDTRLKANLAGSYPLLKTYAATNGPSSGAIFNAPRFQLMSVTWQDPGWPYYLEAYAQGEVGAEVPGGGTRYDTVFAFDTVNGAQFGLGFANFGESVKFQQTNSGVDTAVRTGGRTLVWTAVRAYGSGNGQITAFNWGMRVKLLRAE